MRKQYQFRLVELTCGALGTDHNSTPYIIRRGSQGDIQLSVVEDCRRDNCPKQKAGANLLALNEGREA